MPARLNLDQTSTTTATCPGGWVCQMCDCDGDGCDGTICHGFDAD
jgi:hypothetical protein